MDPLRDRQDGPAKNFTRIRRFLEEMNLRCHVPDVGLPLTPRPSASPAFLPQAACTDESVVRGVVFRFSGTARVTDAAALVENIQS
ncbi:MAG: hypothetical protein ACP5VC_18805, partial [Bryobacteraceae bacterium]